MAESLKRLAQTRDRTNWIRDARVGLSQDMRGGGFEPTELAGRAVAFLARHLGAPAGALYYADGDRQLELLGQYGGAPADGGAPARFRIGEGLVGQAALVEAITVVKDPPSDYLRIGPAWAKERPRRSSWCLSGSSDAREVCSSWRSSTAGRRRPRRFSRRCKRTW